MLQTVWTAVQPALPELLGVVVTVAVTNATRYAKRKWQIDIEARHRDALQSALANGAVLAIERKLTADAAVRLIVAYARQSVPDAIKTLRPASEVLEQLARAKLAKAGK
jgi:hypothetical protein